MTVSHGIYIAGVSVVGLINLLPVIGLLSGERIAAAYGVRVDTPELAILLRHRALLFGLIGGFLLASLCLSAYRGPALALAGLSMAGFLCIALQTGGFNELLRRVVIADCIGLAVLAVALIARTIGEA